MADLHLRAVAIFRPRDVQAKTALDDSDNHRQFGRGIQNKTAITLRSEARLDKSRSGLPRTTTNLTKDTGTALMTGRCETAHARRDSYHSSPRKKGTKTTKQITSVFSEMTSGLRSFLALTAADPDDVDVLLGVAQGNEQNLALSTTDPA